MNARFLKLLYESITRLGLNPSLKAADVPDTRLIELVTGPARLEPGRALDLGCGAGRNAIYLARHGWDVTGIDMIGRAIAEARVKADAGAPARFVHGDVTKLEQLDVGDGYSLLLDSGCYYGLPANQRDAFAAGVTKVAKPGALLLMSGFVKIPITGAFGIGADDLLDRFPGWALRDAADVPAEEILRHTRIPLPVRARFRSGRLKIRRFELIRASRKLAADIAR